MATPSRMTKRVNWCGRGQTVPAGLLLDPVEHRFANSRSPLGADLWRYSTRTRWRFAPPPPLAQLKGPAFFLSQFSFPSHLWPSQFKALKLQITACLLAGVAGS